MTLVASNCGTGCGAPLFVHVLGAMLLVGSVAAAAALAWTGTRRGPAPLSRATFRTLVAAAIPAWVVMRLGAQWVYDHEGFTGKHDPGWLGVGFAVSEPGLVLLLAATGLAFWWTRRSARGIGIAVAVLSSLYLAALAVAWWSMAGKP